MLKDEQSVKQTKINLPVHACCGHAYTTWCNCEV